MLRSTLRCIGRRTDLLSPRRAPRSHFFHTNAITAAAAAAAFTPPPVHARAAFMAAKKEPAAGSPKPDVTGTQRKANEAEWKDALTAAEFYVLREKGTEPANSGELNKFYPKPGDGHFVCAGCGNPLYSAAAKFDSGCGWPAFDKCYTGSVKTEVDDSLGVRRIEIMCNACDGHLGHVFENEGFTITNERHCVNSVSIKYKKGVQPEHTDEEALTDNL